MSLYETHLEKAQEFFDDLNYDAARAALTHALESDHPQDDCRAQAMLGHIYRKLEFDDQARDLFEECITIKPTPDVLAELALILAEKSIDPERATQLAQDALNTDADLGSAHLALYLVNVSQNAYIEALQHLKRGVRRGTDYSESKVFEAVRSWCKDLCDQQSYQAAFEISSEIADFYANFEFYVLHARIAEFANYPRVAVDYYKRTLPFLRTGTPMRNDILEAIARLAI